MDANVQPSKQTRDTVRLQVRIGRMLYRSLRMQAAEQLISLQALIEAKLRQANAGITDGPILKQLRQQPPVIKGVLGTMEPDEEDVPLDDVPLTSSPSPSPATVPKGVGGPGVPDNILRADVPRAAQEQAGLAVQVGVEPVPKATLADFTKAIDKIAEKASKKTCSKCKTTCVPGTCQCFCHRKAS